jgi:hypothetical protein
MKTCPKCKQTLNIDLFYVSASHKSGRCCYCISCSKRGANEWRKSNPERVAENLKRYVVKRRSYSAKYRFREYIGITPDEVPAKLQAQGDKCAICLKELTLQTAVVDHCHTTGAVRDLLCSPCNLRLGRIERDRILVRALAYIERHRGVG